LSAVVGSLSCALLLVIVLGITYRLVRLSTSHRSSLHISPITAIEEQIYAQRSAPPPYPEAMATSRPYDEYQHEIVSNLNQTAATRGVECGQTSDDLGDSSAVGWNAPSASDDDLINVDMNETPRNGAGEDENIVIALGCLARWHRHPKPSADSSESSVSGMDTSPNNATIVCDVPLDTQVTEAIDTSRQGSDPPPVYETSATDHPDDDNDDDRQLLIC